MRRFSATKMHALASRVAIMVPNPSLYNLLSLVTAADS
jgi:hypothetical protein